MKNLLEMLRQDAFGLLVAVVFLLAIGFVIAVATFGLIYTSRTPSYVVVNMNPLHESRLLTVRDFEFDISDEIFAALPDNIMVEYFEDARHGNTLGLSIADISGLTTHDYFEIRDEMADAFVDALISVGLAQQQVFQHTFDQLRSFFSRHRGFSIWPDVSAYVPDASHTRIEVPRPSIAEIARELGWYLAIPIFLLIAPLVVLDLRMRRWRKRTFGIQEV